MSQEAAYDMDKLISADQFLDAAAFRHSVYAISDESPISNDKIAAITEKVLKVTPSSFNSQSTRIQLVLGDEHKKLWDAMTEVVKPFMISVAGEETWNSSFAGRFQGFRGGSGTALFFEDGKTLAEWKEKHASAAHMFDQFSEHTSAMHQINLWTALELEGLGASLQHNNGIPGVEAAIKSKLGLPEEWSLKAQLVFGGKTQPHPQGPAKLPTSETLKVVQ